MRDRIKIISNPISGTGRAARLAREIVDRLSRDGCTAELIETRSPGDAQRLAGDVDGFAAVAGLGGDGTINEVLNGLPEDAAPPLAMIPCGTANVLAKELGLPRRAEAVVELLRRGGERRLDMGVDRESGRKFLLFLSAGFDAHVVHAFHAARTGPTSMWHYAAWGLRCLFRFRFPRMTVELDGTVLTRDASWVQVSNVASYGGPLVFTPRARPDDGRFEVMVLDGGRKRDIVWMFARAVAAWLLGVDPRFRGLTFRQGLRVRLTATEGRDIPVQIDGDPGGHLPVDVEVRPAAIRLLAP